MHIITEYLSMNYFTFIMLLGLAIIQFANRKAKINGVQYIWIIMGLVFLLTILNYLEYWVSAYHKNVRWLYFKTSTLYCIYPLVALLELYLIAPVRRKFLLTLPYILFVAIEIADFFGAHLTYLAFPSFCHELPVYCDFNRLFLPIVERRTFIKNTHCDLHGCFYDIDCIFGINEYCK